MILLRHKQIKIDTSEIVEVDWHLMHNYTVIIWKLGMIHDTDNDTQIA